MIRWPPPIMKNIIMILSDNQEKPALDGCSKRELIRKNIRRHAELMGALRMHGKRKHREGRAAGCTADTSMGCVWATPHHHDEQPAPRLLLPSATQSGLKDPHPPTEWQIGQEQVPGNGEKKRLDLSISIGEIRNQKQYFHQDHSWRGLISQKGIAYCHEGGMTGIQTNLKYSVHQPSLQGSGKLLALQVHFCLEW